MRGPPKALHYFLGKNVRDVTMDNPQERRDAAIYLAAMIQAEGSMILRWSYHGGRKRDSASVEARVVMYNTEAEVVEAIQRYCKILDAGEHVYVYGREGVGFGRKPLFTINIRGFKRLARLLPEVLPFLVGEKLQMAITLYCLSESRANVMATRPYTEEEIRMVNTFPARSRRLESPEANTPDTGKQPVKIESGPTAKVVGGESVSKYPCASVAQ